MTDRILRKAIEKIDSMPRAELKRIMLSQLTMTDLLQSLMENSREGHCVLQDGLIRYANVSFGTMIPTNRLYLSRSEGHHLDEVVTDEQVLEYLQGLEAGDEENAREFSFQQGSEVRIISIVNRTLEIDDKPYLDIVTRDVTSLRRDQARLRRSESLAAMTTMAAGVAHEIKNPLAAMQIHIQLLRKAFQRKGSLTLDDAQRYLGVLEEEIGHLNGIAVDFLFAVRPMNVSLSKQRIDAVIGALEDFVRPELEEHGIRLVVKIQPFLPQLLIDVNYLRQALLNIVKNAMNAMEDGGRLDIDVWSDGDYVKISVKDTGCGIDQEHIGKIFEPYFTTKASGTGLGLTVVYKIVKEHDGDISVSSEVGKGTTFTISLPVPSDERIAIENIEEVSDGHDTGGR